MYFRCDTGDCSYRCDTGDCSYRCNIFLLLDMAGVPNLLMYDIN